MQMAVRTNVAPRSSSAARRSETVEHARTWSCYELGGDIWRTFVEEMVDGVMTPRPGSKGKIGPRAYL